MHKDEALDDYRQAIGWAQRIVMIYPIFWGRPPAMLLGFIDRVFASNFAYRDEGKPLPVGLLKGKEAVVISTMKGPSFYMRLLLRNAHQVLMRRALFNFVGMKRVKFFEFGGMESHSKEGARKREKAFEKVVAYF
jgi:NAD(P)H dehydrogenase (quinone)